MASTLAPSTCLALALTALLLLAGAPRQVAAHGFVADPIARNLLRPACGVGCPHCCNDGGPGESSANGALTWPKSTAAVCGTAALSSAGPVQRTYAPGAVIKVKVLISAQHGGRHVFRLCTSPDVTKPCLAEHTLQRLDGGSPYGWTRIFGGPVPNTEYGQETIAGISGETYTWRFRLPAGVTCDRCVLQWWWTSANSCRVPGAPAFVGSDPGMPLCNTPGPFPEEFSNCVDIRIAPGGRDDGDASWRPWPKFPLASGVQANLNQGNTNSNAEPTTAQLLAMQKGKQQQQQQQAGGGGAQPAGTVVGRRPGRAQQTGSAAVASLATQLCKKHGAAGAQGGYWPDPSNCSRYLQCGPGQGWFMPCPAGLVWDDTAKACNFPSLTNCGSRPLRG